MSWLRVLLELLDEWRIGVLTGIGGSSRIGSWGVGILMGIGGE
jgi:hypothetical protein